MDELSPRARALLAAAQDGHEPPAGAGARVWQAVSSDIAGGVSFEGTRALARQAAWGGGSGVIGKMMWILAVLAAAGFGAAVLFWGDPAPTSPASSETPTVVPPAALEGVAHAEPEAVEERAQSAEQLPSLEPAARPARPRAKAQDRLMQEVLSLRRASDALANDRPAQALALLRTHAKQFARGTLQEEREALTLLARCALDSGGAGAQARSFVARTPNSVLRSRVEKACKLTEGS